MTPITKHEMSRSGAICPMSGGMRIAATRIAAFIQCVPFISDQISNFSQLLADKHAVHELSIKEAQSG
jgi:hypothetical protein